MAIGESLKRFRKEFNLTQTNVADKLGILQQTYYKYENNRVTPSADVVIKLADAYDVSADYLLGLSDTPRPVSYDEKEVREALEFRDTWLKMQRLESAVKARQMSAQ